VASKFSLFIAELKRRKVYHVAGVYLAVGVAISLQGRRGIGRLARAPSLDERKEELMSRNLVLFLVLGVLTALPACSQTREPVAIAIDSEGFEMRGRFFPASAARPSPTVLLIPGYPGNPEDVLGMGARLSREGINVLMVNPRGTHESEGTFTFAGSLLDIEAALGWLRTSEAADPFNIDTANIFLGGYSWGGGMSLAYAATDPQAQRLISIAGNDHGEFIREFQRNEMMAEMIRDMLRSTKAPEGPVRFDLEATLAELVEGEETYGLRENAERLSDRSILLIGGWADTGVTVDRVLLPFYRALEQHEAEDVTFLVYHDDHGFGNVRDQLASDIAGWIEQRVRK
jgi:dienelactone hydrolase